MFAADPPEALQRERPWHIGEGLRGSCCHGVRDGQDGISVHALDDVVFGAGRERSAGGMADLSALGLQELSLRLFAGSQLCSPGWTTVDEQIDEAL